MNAVANCHAGMSAGFPNGWTLPFPLLQCFAANSVHATMLCVDYSHGMS